jgi:hypothetical protein
LWPAFWAVFLAGYLSDILGWFFWRAICPAFWAGFFGGLFVRHFWALFFENLASSVG